jgi:hypothetical protein
MYGLRVGDKINEEPPETTILHGYLCHLHWKLSLHFYHVYVFLRDSLVSNIHCHVTPLNSTATRGPTMEKTFILSSSSLLHKPATSTSPKNDHQGRLVIVSAHAKPVEPKPCSSDFKDKLEREDGKDPYRQMSSRPNHHTKVIVATRRSRQ